MRVRFDNNSKLSIIPDRDCCLRAYDGYPKICLKTIFNERLRTWFDLRAP
jgi:hypothetical protein